jgi:hypothetical protein
LKREIALVAACGRDDSFACFHWRSISRERNG